MLNYGFLRAGHAVKINKYLSCNVPAFILEFERYDYLIGSFHFVENGKNGILEYCVKTSHYTVVIYITFSSRKLSSDAI